MARLACFGAFSAMRHYSRCYSRPRWQPNMSLWLGHDKMVGLAAVGWRYGLLEEDGVGRCIVARSALLAYLDKVSRPYSQIMPEFLLHIASRNKEVSSLAKFVLIAELRIRIPMVA